MSRFKASSRSAVLLLAATLAACSAGRPVPPPSPGAVPAPADAPSAAVLETRVLELDRGLATMRAQARIRYQGPEDKFRSSQMIVVEAPDRVRIDVMNPFGVSYTLASDGARMTAFDRRESRLYEGRASADNVARLAGVPIGMESLAALVRGLPPKLAVRGQGRVFVEGDAWIWRREIADGGHLDVAFASDSLAIRRIVVFDRRGELSMAAEFGDYRAEEGVDVPRRMDATFADGSTLELVYERVWPNIALGAGTFEIRVPGTVERIELDER